MKKVGKKFLKSIIVILIIFVIYCAICFFHSKTLIVELADAMYRDDIEKIYELTGNDFYINSDNKKGSIYDFLEDTQYSIIINDNVLESFSYEIKGVQPTWQGFLYNIDIEMSDFEKIFFSGDNINNTLENKYDEFCVELIRNSFLKGGEVDGMQEITNYAKEQMFWDDEDYKKYGTMTIPGKLIYNVYTRKFIEPWQFYFLEKGGMHNVFINSKFASKYAEVQNGLERIDFYKEDGEEYFSLFDNENFVVLYDFMNNDMCLEKNNYYIENGFLKNEVIEDLAKEGYFPCEQLTFLGIDGKIEVEFCNDNYIDIDSEEYRVLFEKNNFTKNEIIEIFEEDGYYLGEELYFKNNRETIKVFFKNDELMWVKNPYSSKVSEETNKLVEYIERNNLKKDEIIEYLLNQGYVQTEY